MRPQAARALTRAMRIRTPSGPGTPPWVISAPRTSAIEGADRLATEGEILAHLIRRDLDQVAAMYGRPA